MNKLLNYIAHGKDSGAFLLFVLAFLLALYTAFALRSPMLEMVPYVQEQADKMLPITVENGQVTDPVRTVREVDLFADDEENNEDDGFVFVLDTTLDELTNTDQLPEGFYLTRSYFYHVEKNDVDRTRLEGSFTLEKKDYTESLEKFVHLAVLGIAAVVLVLMFIYFLLCAWIYTVLAWIMATLLKFKTVYDFRMRLTCVVFGLITVLEFIVARLGFELPFGIFSVLMIAAQFGLLFYFSKQPRTKKRKK